MCARFNIKRTQILLERLPEPKFALTFITLTAMIIRLLPMRFKYLLGYDPYFHLAYIRYALTHGWVNFFPYARGPWGFQIKYFHPLGLWMTPAFIYKLLKPFGVSLYNAFRITPVIFGVLTVVLTYLVVLRLYSRREAFLSAFLLAVSFGHVFRSMAGYYRGDNYMLFLYSVALLGIALGLTWKRRKWGYERFTFYLIPSLATGLAAFFWQAYYPIFAFVLANAVFISIGAFLLRKDERIIDGLVIALSTVLSVFMANWIGGRFNYGMVSYDRWLGKKLAEELEVHFGILKDAFLLAYLKYAILLALALIILLILASRKIREGRKRILLVGGVLGVLGVLSLKYYPKVLRIVEGIFFQAPIAETVRTTKHDWWTAYGVGGFLIPLFLLRFLSKRIQLGDFIVLGTLVVSLPMAFIWTRFLFMGSLSVAIMTGLGLTALHEELVPRVNGRKAASIALSALISLVPLVAAYQGTETTLNIKPLADRHWERSLEYLGENSCINDVVLSWWDEGHWVTYFAHRAPVAQGSPNIWVAKYYLGKVGFWGIKSLGVDYVIVSYHALMEFGAILETARANPKDYFLGVLPFRGRIMKTYVFSFGSYSLTAENMSRGWLIKVNMIGRTLTPEKAFVEGKTLEKAVPGDTPGLYAYVNLNYGYAVIMNGEAFNTTLARLMFTDDYPEYYRLVYSDGGYIKIFRVIHPNVEIIAKNNSIILKFQNATGTGLSIYGFLDNGTMVYKKWFNVKGKNEFILPENINGSVVVRYTYTKGKEVLDRGVFQMEDVLGRCES